MTLHLYGLLLGLGISVGWVVAEKKATKKIRELLNGAVLWMFAGGVIGARVYHLVTDWQLYRGASFIDLIAIWRGGLGIYGAIIGGVAGVVIFLWQKKQLTRQNLLSLLDLIGLGLPLGQAIGRWGNFFNKELFGLPTNLPWGLEIPLALRPAQFQNATTFHPLFFYESLSLLLVWIFIWRHTGNTKQDFFCIGTGQVFSAYLIAYGVIRFFLDFLRIDRAFFYGVPVGQAVSVIAIAVGLLFLCMNRKKVAKME